jgi:hypothetical protein
MAQGPAHATAFPARLPDFLALIVKAKTPADWVKRLRDFLRDQLSQYGREHGAAWRSADQEALKMWPAGGSPN